MGDKNRRRVPDSIGRATIDDDDISLSSVGVPPVDGCAIVGGSKEKKQLVAVLTGDRLLANVGIHCSYRFTMIEAFNPLAIGLWGASEWRYR